MKYSSKYRLNYLSDSGSIVYLCERDEESNANYLMRIRLVSAVTDLKAGKYVPVTYPDNCNLLCRNISEVGNEQNCCDNFATCACGTVTGHYACICPAGYFGSGLRGSCHREFAGNTDFSVFTRNFFEGIYFIFILY